MVSPTTRGTSFSLTASWALGPFGLAKQAGDGTQWKKIENPLADNGGK